MDKRNGTLQDRLAKRRSYREKHRPKTNSELSTPSEPIDRKSNQSINSRISSTESIVEPARAPKNETPAKQTEKTKSVQPETVNETPKSVQTKVNEEKQSNQTSTNETKERKNPAILPATQSSEPKSKEQDKSLHQPVIEQTQKRNQSPPSEKKPETSKKEPVSLPKKEPAPPPVKEPDPPKKEPVSLPKKEPAPPPVKEPNPPKKEPAPPPMREPDPPKKEIISPPIKEPDPPKKEPAPLPKKEPDPPKKESVPLLKKESHVIIKESAPPTKETILPKIESIQKNVQTQPPVQIVQPKYENIVLPSISNNNRSTMPKFEETSYYRPTQISQKNEQIFNEPEYYSSYQFDSSWRPTNSIALSYVFNRRVIETEFLGVPRVATNTRWKKTTWD